MESGQSAEPRTVVDTYLAALSARDYERARALLADTGFRFVSPVASFDDPDSFIEYTLYSGGAVARVDQRKVFVDGGDVCHFLLLTTYLGDKRQTPVVQWAQVADGRIHSIELLFDAHDYKQMFERPQEPIG